MNATKETLRTVRNEYIDFLKGIAAIGIVAIHTAFWSGQIYTPPWFYNLTLFLDVPLFYFLSGWASSYKKADIIKTSKGIGFIWLKWIYFISILSLFCLFSNWLPITFEGVGNIRDLISNYMFNVSIPGFRVVAGSIWFMPIYFLVIIFNTIIMMFIEETKRVEEYKKLYMYSLGFLFLWVYYGKFFFAIDIAVYSFYSLFWMIGQNRLIKVKNYWKLLLYIAIAGCGIIVTSYLQNMPLYNIQDAKFPPSPKYFFVSIIAVLVGAYFENKIKKYNRVIIHIGKNAIFYFFGQGVGSSLIYFYVESVNFHNWFIKWIIAFILNVICTVFIAEILAIFYKWIMKIVGVRFKVSVH